jgi:lysophospholipase L1-like esterase
MRRFSVILVAVGLLSTLSATAQQQAASDPNRWEPAIQKFEAEDKANPPAKGGVVFIGASSIVRWNLAASFPDLRAVNRGFGGSEMADSARYAARVVLPHAPRVVVLYPGENDLARGSTPETIGSGFARFYDTIRAALPETRIVAIGLKPTPARWQLTDKMHQANALIRSHCASQSRCVYVDVWPAMLGTDGKPKPEHFVSDGQHMSPEGYKVWTSLVRPHLQ